MLVMSSVTFLIKHHVVPASKMDKLGLSFPNSQFCSIRQILKKLTLREINGMFVSCRRGNHVAGHCGRSPVDLRRRVMTALYTHYSPALTTGSSPPPVLTLGAKTPWFSLPAALNSCKWHPLSQKSAEPPLTQCPFSQVVSQAIHITLRTHSQGSGTGFRHFFIIAEISCLNPWMDCQSLQVLFIDSVFLKVILCHVSAYSTVSRIFFAWVSYQLMCGLLMKGWGHCFCFFALFKRNL